MMKFAFKPIAVLLASTLGFALEYAAFFHVATQGSGVQGASVIDDKTLVSLGTALAILSPIGIGCFWLIKTLDGIKKELKDLRAAGRETWSYNQQRVWALELEKANRSIGLAVPTPEKPVRLKSDDDRET